MMMSTPLLSLNSEYTNSHESWVNAFNQRITGNVVPTNKQQQNVKQIFCASSMPMASSKPKMSLPIAIIKTTPYSSPHISISLPILCPQDDKFTRSKNDSNSGSLEGKMDCEGLMASSLPNIKFLEDACSKMSIRMDSLDLFQKKQIKDDLSCLKKELSTDNSNDLDDDPVKPKPCRKNSQMAPVLPSLELLAQYKQKENDNKLNEKNSQATYDGETSLNDASNIVTSFPPSNDGNGHKINNDLEAMRTTSPTPKSIVVNLSNDKTNGDVAVAIQNEDEEDEDTEIKAPHLSRCGLLFRTGSEKESAAAWLAAATKQLSRQLNNTKCNQINGNIKSIDDGHSLCKTIIDRKSLENKENSFEIDAETRKSIENEQFKEKDQRHQRVRRTSILRKNHSSFNYEKKNVRFADNLGFNLEDVRYFVSNPPITRRYSSYTSPTYLNTEWSSGNWNGVLLDKTNSNPQLFTPSNNAKKPQTRYELVISNFTNPSLCSDFTHRLFQKNVLLHSLTTAETTVYGTVSVVNIHFVKKVFVRYSFNDWANYIEREATYMLGSHDGNTDKFSFVIYVRPQDFNIDRLSSSSPPSSLSSSPHQQSLNQTQTTKQPKMSFAIKFVVGDVQEFWDNNDGQNYNLDLKAFP